MQPTQSTQSTQPMQATQRSHSTQPTQAAHLATNTLSTVAALAKPGCVLVALERPLAGRRLVDGSQVVLPLRNRRRAERTVFRRFGRCRPVPVER